VLKDTGARAGEACKLQWIDLDDQNGTIRINNPEKGSRSRTIKVTPKTVAMLKALRKKYGNNINHDRNALADSFRRKRIQLSQKLQNPRFMQIHFHSFRHWKATMEYSRTKDILYVKHILGHRRLESTEIYTHLIEFKNEEYHTAHAKTLEEEDKLLEAGFDYVRYSDKDQIAIYRKRK
jgi:integrase